MSQGYRSSLLNYYYYYYLKVTNWDKSCRWHWRKVRHQIGWSLSLDNLGRKWTMMMMMMIVLAFWDRNEVDLGETCPPLHPPCPRRSKVWGDMSPRPPWFASMETIETSFCFEVWSPNVESQNAFIIFYIYIIYIYKFIRTTGPLRPLTEYINWNENVSIRYRNRNYNLHENKQN